MTTAELERASSAAPRPELDWERDWQGRPRILPDPTWTPETAPAGWVKDGALLESREYTRVTTFAEALQDSSALTRWKLRRAVLGMGRRPDYVVTAASLTAEDRDRDALDDLAEKALEASGPNAADVGTALHAFTDRIDRGEELGQVPEQYLPTLVAYTKAVAHLRFVEWEVRTVCDDLETAGTPDRLGFCDIPDPDGVTDALRIIDTKTGRVDYSAGKFSTQLAIYRRSAKYHPGTGARTSWEELHGKPVSRWGLVVHIPAGAGTAELLWLDLEHGNDGAEEAARVRRWRQGAKAGNLLRPVFARAPRPATTDGTCRGRKADGEPCGYKRKTKAEGLQAQFCGRHADQAAGLERWLAENPGVDPASGEETAPSMRPVQPSSPAVAQLRAEGHTWTQELAQAEANEVAPEPENVTAPAFDRPAPADSERTTPEQDAAYTAGDLICWRAMPNGWLMAPVGAVCVTPDGVRWMKVQRSDAYGWEREERVLAAGGPEHVTCSRTNLPVRQCACSVHRPDLVSTAAAVAASDPAAAAIVSASEIAQQLQEEQTRPVQELPPLQSMDEQLAAVARGEDPDAAEQEQLMVPPLEHVLEALPPESIAYAAAVDQWRDMAMVPEDHPDVQRARARHEAARATAERTAALRAAQEDAPLITREQITHAMGVPETVGTYALDPETEQNGNRRPHSGLQTPEDAGHALRSARAALFDLIDACHSETELRLLYGQHADIWTQPHTDRAGARSRQLQEEHAREAPEAALLSALETAPDLATMARLWQQYGGGQLWTADAQVVAQRRYEMLQNTAQL